MNRIESVKHSHSAYGRGSMWLVALLLFSVSSSGITWAQAGMGRITGSVLDPSGFSVAGAKIEIDSASGARLIATTDKEGSFSVAVPANGTYSVRVEAAGFVAVAHCVQNKSGGIAASASYCAFRLNPGSLP